MEPYAPIPDDGPFAASTGMFTSLVADLQGPFEAAHAAITSRCGPVIGRRQIGQAVVNAAGDISTFYAARIPEPCTARAARPGR